MGLRRTDGRLDGSWPETAFAEIGASIAFRNTAFPPSGLMTRNNFRLCRHALAVLINRGPTFIKGVKIDGGRCAGRRGYVCETEFNR